MGLLGNSANAGCAPLGQHLLGKARQAFPTDGVALGDSSQSFTREWDLADGLNLGDSITLIQNRYKALADGVDLGDSLAAQVAALLADGLDLGDSLAAQVAALLADGLALGDSRASQLSALLGDGLALGDSQAATINAALADGIDLGDTIYLLQAFYKLLEDGIDLGDAIAQFHQVLADGLALGDVPIQQVEAVLADGIDLGDVAQFRAVLADGLVLSDTTIITVYAVVADGIALGDTGLYFTVLPEVIIELQSSSDGAAPHQVINLTQGDVTFALVFVLTFDGQDWQVPEDATVSFRMRARDAEAGVYVVDAACLRSSENVYQYILAAGDTDTPGEYYAEIVIQYSGMVYSSEMFIVRIRAAL